MIEVGLFTLRSHRWYSWQMLPGYEDSFRPYYSPIFIEKVTPLKTGKGIVRITFLNAAYAAGVQNFELAFQVLKRATTYMIGELADDHGPCKRAAVIGEIDFEWLRRNFSAWLEESRPDEAAEPIRSDVQLYLDGRLRGGALR